MVLCRSAQAFVRLGLRSLGISKHLDIDLRLRPAPSCEFSTHQIHERIDARIKFNSLNMERGGSRHIVILVADQKTAIKINLPFTRGLFEHSGRGLSAAASHR